ncbi:MAG TPA: hypothetical protein PKA64_18625, partial [Myxococcota bacterium]|nr:hypothetical protein [Myxococcota bacterium]
HVVDASGAPLVGVDLEVWHADPAGDYDLTTPEMRYRGVMTSGAAGEWCLTTLRPGVYASGGVTRPCHLHVRLSRGGVERLVTQLYPGDDPLVGGVRRALVMSMVDDGAGGQRSAFTFVL